MFVKQFQTVELLHSMSDTLKPEHAMNSRKTCVNSHYIFRYIRLGEYWFNRSKVLLLSLS